MSSVTGHCMRSCHPINTQVGVFDFNLKKKNMLRDPMHVGDYHSLSYFICEPCIKTHASIAITQNTNG